MQRSWSPARAYCAVIGPILVIVGIVGFFYSTSFRTDHHGDDELLGIFMVNGWHNTVHIVTGVLALLAVAYGARLYCWIFGIIYIVLAVWGFILGNEGVLLDIVPIDTADNFLVHDHRDGQQSL